MASFTQPLSFLDRHLGAPLSDITAMAAVMGIESPDALIQQALPSTIHRPPLTHTPPISEAELLLELDELSTHNQVATSYIGMGFYGCHTPSVIQRQCFENPSWVTAYTPYQAEISQGRLEALFHFQTVVTDLTGLPITNASLLDDATATAEAMTMLFRVRTDLSQTQFLIPNTLFPHVKAVLQLRATPLGIVIEEYLPDNVPNLLGVFGVLIDYPNGWGVLSDPSSLTKRCMEWGVKVVAYCELLSLTMLTPPGEWGATIAVGSAQRLGVPLGYGGPSAAFIATTQELVRQLPGRIIGLSKDRLGQPAYRMALQTREQHIRREKATSNICTAQALLAVMAAFYCIYHGPDGLLRIAKRIHELTTALALQLTQWGFQLGGGHFFDTVSVFMTTQQVDAVCRLTEANGMNVRRVGDTMIGFTLDETSSPEGIQRLCDVLAKALGQTPSVLQSGPMAIPNGLRRQTSFLTQSVFQMYHTEMDMMRYMHRLASKDMALNTAMIPLGSCTMKLNPVTALMPVSWRAFSCLHPFAPLHQAAGYHQVFDRLAAILRDVTELDGVSLQPNSGSQGEYAGLMVIRAYQTAIGQGHRDVALIPSSAHGTNPASAAMAGLKIVVVRCDESGDIDTQDLQRHIAQYQDRLSVLMVTYPSTHGVFEAKIQSICGWIHDAGGQVYMDGANMNAQVGITSPGRLGADVCHINLHKTFAIPHGGGGPGMGPIVVRGHLVPYLPGHPLVQGESTAIGPVSAAPWGSASILLISYAYARLLGSDGLTRATKKAIWNANYIKSRIQHVYDILFTGPSGWVAHELIIQLTAFKKSADISVDDVAKRLMDYGFHAPTVSFPVAGTMMIEPTESESKAELDRFCDALLAIREEIRLIEVGQWGEDNPLKNAPHPVQEVCSDDWQHVYSRRVAMTEGGPGGSKWWPHVARVDGAYGDRNLICSCPPVSELASMA